MSAAAQMAPEAPDATLERLNDQLGWYDSKSATNRRFYLRLKICTLVFAAVLPALAGRANMVTAILGILIVVVEGLQQLFQYHANWITYRSTAEALKHEKYLYIALAGPYSAAANPRALLAERVESLVSQEQNRWASNQEQATQKK